MKLKTPPFHLLQIFTNVYEYGKAYKNYESRKEDVKWKKQIRSESAIEENVLIRKDCYAKRTGILEDVVILVDHNLDTYQDFLNLQKLKGQSDEDNNWNQLKYRDQQKEKKGIFLGKLQDHFLNFEIFQFKLGEEIEVYLNWDYWKVGGPERAAHKIAELKRHKPVEIKIDGKRDFSATGRRARTFIENNYILEYKGVMEGLELVEETRGFIKGIPEEIKEINLMKYLK